MLPFILSSLFALAQCVPTASVPTALEIRSLTPNLARDLATFQSFKFNVSGPSLFISNWHGEGLCSFEGVTCGVNPDTKLTSLAGIDFNGSNLKGHYKLTNFLDKLLDIVFFHANSNGFSDIPNLSELKYLAELDLGNNKYSGDFPDAILTARKLLFLNLGFNNFKGALPGTVFSAIPKLDALWLYYNQFSGNLPPNIGAFPGSSLKLQNNQFSGTIPESLSSAYNLVEISLSHNQLSGTIPVGLGALSNLESFDASYNKLTGGIPEDLCSIKTLRTLVLTGNKLSRNLGPRCNNLKRKGILKF